MRVEDIVTAGLIAFAVYFVIVTLRDGSRRPRTYYAEPGTNDWWA